MSAIDEAEKLLLERYNVDALDGDLAASIAALRESATPETVAQFEALNAERQMFRWREPFDAALAALMAEAEEPEPEDISRLTVTELTDRLTERGVEIPTGAKKADLVELLGEGAVE